MAKSKAGRTVRIDAGVDCPRCLRHVVLERIAPAVRCGSCAHEIALDWQSLVKARVADALKGEGGRSTDFGDELLAVVRVAIEAAPGGTARAATTADRRAVHAKAVQVIGEREPAMFVPPEPVAFRCPRCASTLRTDGTARAIPCATCAVEIDVPEALWQLLHPIRRRASIYVRLE
jgi:DNA-directed RNA polymerase subunit RPC12/RpoP